MGPVFETGRRRAARFFRTASASLRREGNSTEVTSIEREDHPLPGVPVCRNVREDTVAEVVGPCAAQVVFALSRGERRRSLAFHFDVSSGSHRKVAGQKEAPRVEGEDVRSRGAQAHRKMRRRDHDGWFWVKVLAGTHGHGARSKDLTSRKGTLRWKASWFAPSWFSSRKPADASLAQRPQVGNKLELKPTRPGGAKATGTPEVGSHRIAVDENSTAGWTDPPK